MSEGSIVTRHRHTFIRRKGLLYDLNRDISDSAEEALTALKQVMTTTKDEKLKADCAKTIINMGIEIATLRNTDQMTRLIAECKFNADNNTTSLTAVDNTPVIDFSTIVEAD